jgi:hypothetical protein
VRRRQTHNTPAHNRSATFQAAGHHGTQTGSKSHENVTNYIGNLEERMIRTAGGLVVGLALTLGSALGVATADPAMAANTDTFSACVPAFCNLSNTNGTITWFNRTANVTGNVVDIGPGNTQAIFKAFATNTQIGPTQTRTADDDTSLGSPRGFNFPIGDTNLVGGINKITVQVCSVGVCGPVETYTK